MNNLLSDRWGAPIPLSLQSLLRSNGPTADELGDLGQGILEATRQIQAPQPYAILIALAAGSTLTQGLYDVERPVGGPTSASLLALLIACSGERKSALINYFYDSIRKAEHKLQLIYEQDLMCYEVELTIWISWQKELDKQLKKIAKTLVHSDSQSDENKKQIERLRQKLRDHKSTQPLRPARGQIIYEDCTPEALAEGLHTGLKNACVLADEGTKALDTLITTGTSMINSTWSGVPINVTRKSSESFRLEGHRIALVIAVQPDAFGHYRSRTSDRAQGTGLWARVLVCSDYSSIGLRTIQLNETSTVDTSGYKANIENLIERNILRTRKKQQIRCLLAFDDDATHHYINLSNDIEREMSPGGHFHNATDHASKLMENIARVSAIIHIVNNLDGKISTHTFILAARICIAFSNCYLRTFNAPPQLETDAETLLLWLRSESINKGYQHLPKREMQQYGPSSLKKDSRFKKALEFLELNGLINVFKDANHKIWITPKANPTEPA